MQKQKFLGVSKQSSRKSRILLLAAFDKCRLLSYCTSEVCPFKVFVQKKLLVEFYLDKSMNNVKEKFLVKTITTLLYPPYIVYSK